MPKAMKLQEIKRNYELDPQRFTDDFVHLLESKQIRPQETSIGDLAYALMGSEWFNGCGPARHYGPQDLLETATAVSYSHFSNITGQIFFSMVKEAYENEEFAFSAIVPSKPSSIQDIEKIPGISDIGDEAVVIGEGDSYPMVGVSEDWQEVAAKEKRGFIVPVTREAIFGDLTGVLLDRCSQQAYFMGLNKEKRIIDCVIDENTGAKSAYLGGHRYTWRGTAYATYQTTTPWDNVTASAALVDYTDIQEAWQTLKAITNPFTDEPIIQTPDTLIVQTGDYWDALHILQQTNVRRITPGFDTANNPIQGDGPNLVKSVLPGLKVISSQQLVSRTATDTDWWLGSPSKAFCYFYNWDIETEDAPANSTEAFHRDIVFQKKVSEKGVAATIEPRYMTKCTA